MISSAASALNESLEQGRCNLRNFLSRRGLSAYFPSCGILGQSAEAAGAEINATIGTASEEDGSPLRLACLASLVSLPPRSFLYAPSYGLPDLRRVWRDMMLEKNPALRGKSFSEPVVTQALTHGLSVAGHLFVNPGDSIILPDFFWDNYSLVFEQTWGASLDTFPTFAGAGFNVPALEKLLLAPGERKILLLNFPNNPTGYSPTEDEATAIRDAVARAAAAGKTVIVIVDDAYFGLVYEPGIRTESLFADLVDLHPNVLAVKLDGPTKEDYVWGFRVGFITFGARHAGTDQYRALADKAAGVVRGSVSNVSNISQGLLLKAYADPGYQGQKESKKEVLQARYNRIKEIFADHPEYAGSFIPMPFNSGYFMCVALRGVEPEKVRRRLLEAYGTGVIVVSGVVRLAFSSVPLAKLEALFAALYAAVGDVARESDA